MNNTMIDKDSGDINAPVGRMEWLRADTIRPWKHQRDLSKAAAVKIARDFDPDTLGTLTITRRDGVNYLLDGQHRLVAIKDVLGWGEQNVPCVVYEGLTDQQEAKLFTAQAIGMRRSLPPLHSLYVDYHAGVDHAQQLVATVERCGLRMGWKGNSKTSNSLSAARALLFVAERYGQHRLQVVLEILRDSLGPSSRAYSSDFIRGLIAFHVRFADRYSKADLIERLRATGIAGLARMGAEQQAANGGARDVCTGRAILKVYDRNRSTRRLGQWPENFIDPSVTESRLARAQITNQKNIALGQPGPGGKRRSTDFPRASDTAAD